MLYQACNMKLFLSQPYNSFHIYSTNYIPFAKISLWTSPRQLIPSFFHIRGFSVWYHLDTNSIDSYCILVVYGAELHRKFVSVDPCDSKASCMKCCRMLRKGVIWSTAVTSSSMRGKSSEMVQEWQAWTYWGGLMGQQLPWSRAQSCSTYCLSSSYAPAILKLPLSHFQTWAEINKF